MKSIDTVFESLLWNSRFAVLLAVIGAIVAAFALFFVTSIDVVVVVGHAVHYADTGLSAEARIPLHDGIVTHVVEVVDGYLLAAVLVIFALGLYELFIREIGHARRTPGASRILVIDSLDDLKGRLAKVILLILIVNLFRDALRVTLVTSLDLVYQGAAIALIGLALYLSEKAEPTHHRT